MKFAHKTEVTRAFPDLQSAAHCASASDGACGNQILRNMVNKQTKIHGTKNNRVV